MGGAERRSCAGVHEATRRARGFWAALNGVLPWCVSHFCGRDYHAGGRAMQAAIEVGCAECNESVAIASASAAIIKEK